MTAAALAGSIAATVATGSAPVLAHADKVRSVRRHPACPASGPSASSSRSPLVFGIYPGGAAGTVGPSGPVKAEDPVKRLAALRRLQPAKGPFVVRLYAAYLGPGGPSAAQQVGGQIAGYTKAGLDAELVLTYRPQTGGAPGDVRSFSDFARAAVRSLGHSRRFVSLQVTNEANVGGAPNVADGYYAGAKAALVAGIVAAKHEARDSGFTQVKVGFNWAYVTDRSERDFWSYLGERGGRRFRADVDWVGIDVYPGTWGPALRGRSPSAGATGFIDHAFARLRAKLITGGIPTNVPLHVSESGYPTGPGRTEAMQSESLTASIMALHAARRTYDITNYTWFDLRDANSSTDSFQTHYGILRDDYSPKAAFAVYKSLVAKLSCG